MLSTFGVIIVPLYYLLLSLLKDGMTFDDIKDLLPAVSASSLLDHLCEVSELLYWICDLLSEPQNDCPNDEKEDHTCREH